MPKRSLILAGGGLKVGFQAGVLQVWLDEAGLTFDHADGASGGCFNLAMYCQGFSGTQIADAWRNYDPFLPLAQFRDEVRRCAEELGFRSLKLQPKYQALNVLSARSDFYFVSPGLHPVRVALRAAIALSRIRRANLVLAVLYNVLAVGLAYAGVMSPLLCAVIMPASSLTIIAVTAFRLSPRRSLWRS